LLTKRGIVFGVPRSGTSWLGALLGAHARIRYRFQPIDSYSFEPRLEPTSTPGEIVEFFRALEKTKDPYVTGLTMGGTRQRNKEGSPPADWTIFKEVHDFLAISNATTADSDTRLIGIVRNPLSVLQSWASTPGEWLNSWDISQEWWQAKKKNMEYPGNHFGLAEWIRTTHGLIDLERRFSDRVRVVRYEELNRAPVMGMTEILKLFDLQISRSVLNEINKLKNRESNEPYSVQLRPQSQRKTTDLPPAVKKKVVDRVTANGLGSFLS